MIDAYAYNANDAITTLTNSVDTTLSQSFGYESMACDCLLSMRIPRLLICAVVSLTGCEGEMSDGEWIQQRTVAMNGADFKKCVTMAMGEIKGVSIDHARSTGFDIALNVRLAQPIPFVGVDVRHRMNDTAEIVVTGKDAQESNEERATIAPLLEAIAAAISRECTRSDLIPASDVATPDSWRPVRIRECCFAQEFLTPSSVSTQSCMC